MILLMLYVCVGCNSHTHTHTKTLTGTWKHFEIFKLRYELKDETKQRKFLWKEKLFKTKKNTLLRYDEIVCRQTLE